MNDTYVECLVARKPSPAAPVIKAVAIGITAALIIFGIMMMNIVFLLPGLACAAACYFLLPTLSIEYEYLLLSGEFTIDKIMSKENRKNVLTVTLDKMDIFAEKGAYQLDSYNNSNLPEKDFSSGEEGRRQFVMVLHNSNAKEKLILEPNDEMIEAMKLYYPGKVFLK